MDSVTGQIKNDQELIFPADDLGNYFYLRLPNSLGADYGKQYQISDVAQGIGIRYDVVLVAVVNDADNSLLLENMLTTLMRYNKEELKITKAIFQTDVIILQELKKDLAPSALQRFSEGDTGICCVNFSFTIPFVAQQLTCIQNPCKSC